MNIGSPSNIGNDLDNMSSDSSPSNDDIDDNAIESLFNFEIGNYV